MVDFFSDGVFCSSTTLPQVFPSLSGGSLGFGTIGTIYEFVVRKTIAGLETYTPFDKSCNSLLIIALCSSSEIYDPVLFSCKSKIDITEGCDPGEFIIGS